MAEVIRMPRLSDTMEEGNIIGWLKKVGEKVSPGDILAEVETDKATMDLESFHEGYLLYIGKDEGTVPVDGIIAVIGEKGEDFEALIKEDTATAPGAAKEAEAATEEVAPAPAAATASAPSTSGASSSDGRGNSDGRVKASPLAKSIAKENNLDISAITGSGEGGRIIKKDVESAIQSGGASASKGAAPAVNYGSFGAVASTEIPLTQMRKTIAKRLGESKFTAPHFYLTIDINMDRAVEARKVINAKGEHRISFNDIVVKASALALRKHPMVNASWMGDKIVVNGHIDIGVAVAVDEGLLVPVVRHTDMKPLHVINAEVKEMAGRAREKRLKPDEMQGNTFTISNLGMFGIDEFTAIINPPASCILAVGGIAKKAIVVDGQIQVGSMMKVTLSCDHRVVDGATGAAYLQTLQAYLENPLNMLV